MHMDGSEVSTAMDTNLFADKSRHVTKSRKSAKFKRAQQELKKCMGLEESVIKSYSCAWQKDILIHGRIHLTQNWICFYSNILGWETKACINLKDVTSISKQKVALVFPNAILVEAGDKKYGFASFVHRDRTYKVMELIWQNSQLHEPSTGETLRGQLCQFHQHLSTGRRSKSSSFTGDSSDVETSSMVSSNSPSHSPSRSTSYTNKKVAPLQLAVSDSDWGPSPQDEEQADGVMHRIEPQPSSTSTCSGSEESTDSCHTPCGGPHQFSDVDLGTEASQSNESFYKIRNKHSLNRSPSLLTLKPSMSEASAVQPEPMLGGSPNFLHHWKRTLSMTTLWQTVVTVVKPQRLPLICSPSRLINMLIILFIMLLLLSTVSMLCQLSKVEPALQPYLSWQPWCTLC